VKKFLAILSFSVFSLPLFAQSEIGPEGNKLFWVGLVLLAFGAGFLLAKKRFPSFRTKPIQSLFSKEKVHVLLEKDAKYYPDNLRLTVKNTGNADVDLDQPLLVFDNFWLKRKFKIKGSDKRQFYPLYLDKGKTHVLDIDIYRFYRHDKRLKKFPKVKIYIRNVKGKKLGSRSVFLRKTLIKF